MYTYYQTELTRRPHQESLDAALFTRLLAIPFPPQAQLLLRPKQPSIHGSMVKTMHAMCNTRVNLLTSRPVDIEHAYAFKLLIKGSGSNLQID